MHNQRDGGPSSRLPDPYSLEYHARKIVLLELVVDPPDDGDRLAELIERLGLIGLAAREDDVVRATLAARYFEYLWPVLL